MLSPCFAVHLEPVRTQPLFHRLFFAPRAKANATFMELCVQKLHGGLHECSSHRSVFASARKGQLKATSMRQVHGAIEMEQLCHCVVLVAFLAGFPDKGRPLGVALRHPVQKTIYHHCIFLVTCHCLRHCNLRHRLKHRSSRTRFPQLERQRRKLTT